MNKLREIELFKSIKKGDKRAFHELFSYYYPRLCIYVEKLTKRRDIAEEIVQELFLKIWEDREYIVITSSLKYYLFKSAHNNSLKYFRSQKRERVYIENNFKIINQAVYEIPDYELPELLNQSINELPKQCRKIFIMSRLENLKHADIADKLGISTKTVEVQIRKANLKLRDKLKKYMN